MFEEAATSQTYQPETHDIPAPGNDPIPEPPVSPFDAMHADIHDLCNQTLTSESLVALIQTTQHYLALVAQSEPEYVITEHRQTAVLLAQEAKVCTSLADLLSAVKKVCDQLAPSTMQQWTLGLIAPTGGRLYHVLHELHNTLLKQEQAASDLCHTQHILDEERHKVRLLQEGAQALIHENTELSDRLVEATIQRHRCEEILKKTENKLAEQGKKLEDTQAQLEASFSTQNELKRALLFSQKETEQERNHSAHLIKANQELQKKITFLQEKFEAHFPKKSLFDQPSRKKDKHAHV